MLIRNYASLLAKDRSSIILCGRAQQTREHTLNIGHEEMFTLISMFWSTWNHKQQQQQQQLNKHNGRGKNRAKSRFYTGVTSISVCFFFSIILNHIYIFALVTYFNSMVFFNSLLCIPSISISLSWIFRRSLTVACRVAHINRCGPQQFIVSGSLVSRFLFH